MSFTSPFLRRSPREVPFLVGGAVLVVIILIAGRVVPKVVLWDRGEIAASESVHRELLEAQARLARQATVRQALLLRKERLMSQGRGLMLVRNVRSAAGSFSALVSTAASEAGFRLGPLNLTRDSIGTPTFARVFLRGDGYGDVAAVTEFLSALESAERLVGITEISVTQPDPNGPDSRPEILHVEFMAVGLLATDKHGIELVVDSSRAVATR